MLRNPFWACIEVRRGVLFLSCRQDNLSERGPFVGLGKTCFFTLLPVLTLTKIPDVEIDLKHHRLGRHYIGGL